MKLYNVQYKTWNRSFSNLIDREKLSVGNNEEDAINRVKKVEDKDARDFKAIEINKVLGYDIEDQENIFGIE